MNCQHMLKMSVSTIGCKSILIFVLIIFFCSNSILVLCKSSSSSNLNYDNFRGLGGYTVSYDNRAVLLNNTHVLLQSGSIHYPRSTPAMWPSLLKLAKSSGLNMIEFYVFWNYHEFERGKFDFQTESRNLLQFIENIAEAGLFGFIRLGPYVCAEWLYGGFPVWLRDDNSVWRTNDKMFENEMASFLDLIIEMIQPYLARSGGPIILAQIENEYGNVEEFYPNHTAYIQWAANYALNTNIGIPWVMCQQADAPRNIINTCNGFYCDNWYIIIILLHAI
jgi:hypothetical protein